MMTQQRMTQTTAQHRTNQIQFQMIIPLADMADDDEGIGALLPWMLCPIYTLNLNEFQVTVCSHDSLWFCHNGISNI